MQQPENITINLVNWQQAEAYLRQVRTIVFIQEQLVAPELEWDEMDSRAIHLLAMCGNQAVGCLRIIHYEKVGRMAVLKPWRGLGVGKMLLNEAIRLCRQQGSKQIAISAQKHANHFYEQAGFKITSKEYLDVNIVHVDMRLDLD
ncbi:MAG: GNAT family N-acetyltransferase [Proteobacteria bacterium ST_bin12]|nr:MAG: GNAT family N-acetyltransferase [Proteobacteria bacterium ST_bin12]